MLVILLVLAEQALVGGGLGFFSASTFQRGPEPTDHYQR
jgi:hypothetical protein